MSPNVIIPDYKAKIEVACRIVAGTINEIGRLIKPGISTSALDQAAEEYIRTSGGRPAFKGYIVDGKAFPYSLCISINDEVVHGMPSNRKICEGDLVSIDCGVEKDGFYGDSAYTFSIGTDITEENYKLLKITKESLYLGIEKATAKHRVYDIAASIQTHVESAGFSVVRELVGHGIGTNLHEDPAIPNFVPALLYRKRFPNQRLKTGTALAIEPMVNAGSHYVKTADDGWTICTVDGRPSAHFEHTVLVEDNKAIILTEL